MDLNYTNSKVEWNIDGQKKEYYCEGIEFACVEKSWIYIEILDSNTYEYRFLEYGGKEILKYSDELHKIILTKDDNNEIVLKLEGLQDVSIFQNNIVALLKNDKGGSVKQISEDGTMIKEYLPPIGYTFYRFADMEKGLTVVCQGNSLTCDKFGRNDWVFQYDEKIATWNKKSLSY